MCHYLIGGCTSEFDDHIYIFFNLSWHATSDIFNIKKKKKKKPLATSAFSIQHLTAMTILTQG
jgi:hypothetical protein